MARQIPGPEVHSSLQFWAFKGKVMALTIESLAEVHREPVMDIFNHYIENSMAAYPETRVPNDFFQKLMDIAKQYPAVVARDEGRIIGFALLRPYHPLAAFSGTVEISYFLAPDSVGQGLGKILLDYLENQAREKGFRTILANISSLNEPSIRFHQKNGFSECGRFLRVGRKFGKDFDQVWMQKEL